jgi:hypothetical protein
VDADRFWNNLKRFDKREYLMMAAS